MNASFSRSHSNGTNLAQSLADVTRPTLPIVNLNPKASLKLDSDNVHFHFYQQIQGEHTIIGGRDVVVMLPKEATLEPGRRFPAVYMLDGDNLFEAVPSQSPMPRWQVARSCRELIDKQLMEPIIIVAIFNGGKEAREADYTHVPHPDWPENATGFANNFAKFMFYQLMPVINSHYPTEPGKAGIIGSSLGGLFSLFALSEHKELLGKVAALSPSLQWNKGDLISRFEHMERAADMFVVAGHGESQELRSYTSELFHLLVEKGWNVADHFKDGIDPQGVHDELSWRRQIKIVLPFLYPAK